MEVVADREAAQRPEQVGPDQQTGRWHAEDVADRIVLFLIEFAGFDQRVDFPEAIHAMPDVLQHRRIVPVDEFRADDTSVRPVHLLDQRTDRVGRQGHVIVHEAEETAALDETHRLVGRGTEARVARHSPDERVGKLGLDPLWDVARFTGDQEEQIEIGVVLVGQRVQDLVKPGSRLVHDDHAHNGRCGTTG